MKRELIVAALSMIVSAAAQAETISCQHFWKSDASGEIKWIPSGRPVGIDVGPSPYGSEGVYRCEITIDAGAPIFGKYLFVGEVGDASYLALDETPSGIVTGLPIVTHGWSPDGTAPARYLRFLPFFFPAEYVFHNPGRYKFSIYYYDIVPLQTGIRSGPLSMESGLGLFVRIVKASVGTVYYLIQCVAALLTFVFFVGWTGIPVVRRFALAFVSVLAASVFFSFTSIPRFLLDPLVAIRLNDTLVILAVFGVNAALSFFLSPKNRFPLRIVNWTFFVLSGVEVFLLNEIALDSKYYIPIYSISLVIGAGLYPVCLGVGTYADRLMLSYSPNPSKLSHVALNVTKGILFGWDAFDLCFLHAKFPFVTHYFYLLLSLGLLIRMQMVESASEIRFQRELQELRKGSLRTLTTVKVEREDAFNLLAEGLGKILMAARVSITEVIDRNSLRFVGCYGEFQGLTGLQSILQESPSEKVVESGKLQDGYAPARVLPGHTHQEEDTEFYVIPLFNEGKISGILSLTNFELGRFSPFLKRRLEVAISECSMLFSLLLAERKARMQTRLLQLNRLRVHPLQIKSEQHYLERFDVSEKILEPPFILGDLVDSSILNERYGGSVVRKIIDEHLFWVFENFKDLGIILSRDKGDSVSIIVPNQIHDTSIRDAVSRAFAVIEFLAGNADGFQQTAKKCGVAMPFQYRFALSVANVKLQDKQDAAVLTGFNLLADAAIDGAARVIGSVALPGEIIIMEPAAKWLNAGDLVEIPPTRLKGKIGNIRLYSLRVRQARKAA